MTNTTTRLALPSDAEAIVALSAQVQDHLTASGSLQEIGPLSLEAVISATNNKRAFVYEDNGTGEILGCAFVRPLDAHYYAPSADFDITAFVQPWNYVHSVMLRPEVQERGLGKGMFAEVVELLRPLGATVVLDCWDGNVKLRGFYERCGWRYVASLPKWDFYVAVFALELVGGTAIEQ